MDLKIKDVAELLNVSEATVRRWLIEGKIPAYRIKNQDLFCRTQIESWVMNQRLSTHDEAGPFKEKNKTEELEINSAKGGIKQYSLYRALHKGGVVDPVQGSSKEEVIRTTMRTIAKNLNLDAEVLSDLLMDRENLQSTGIGHGIAIPHTRDYLLNTHQDIVVVAFPEKPLAYGALDHKLVHTLFFLFACEDKRHLHLLAKIAHLSSLPQTMKLLQSKPNKETLLEYVKNWESSVQMVPEEHHA